MPRSLSYWESSTGPKAGLTCCETNAKYRVWTAILLDVNGMCSERVRLKPGVSEVTGVGNGGNTTSVNFCQQVTDLNNLGYPSQTIWYVLSAVQAHEDVHFTKLLPSLIQAVADYQTVISNLTVPVTGQSEADAIFELKSLSGYTTLVNNARTIWDGYYVTLITLDHNPGGATDVAEHLVVDPIISTICNFAHSNGWASCPACP